MLLGSQKAKMKRHSSRMGGLMTAKILLIATLDTVQAIGVNSVTGLPPLT
jgi:hypothetical protein